jgi:selenocysteine-specific elongation factor
LRALGHFHADNLKRAEELLRDYLSKQKDIAASQFRDLLNISRKHAIPLLEHFDNCGVTMRVGDKRVLMAGGQTAG